MSVNSNSNIVYEDTDGKGNLTLIKNPFDKDGNSFYARVDRITVDIDNLIARAVEKDGTMKATTMKYSSLLLKEAVLDALKRGECVNLLGLCTLYPSPVGTTGKTPENTSVEKFHVKCIASKETNKAVENIKVNKVSVFDSSPLIDVMTDVYTGKTDGNFSAGKVMKIEGGRLKIGGDAGGIFFAPATESGDAVEDESKWIEVDKTKIIRNQPRELEFFLPSSLVAGERYCVILKTNFSRNTLSKKNVSSAISDAITIVES